MLRVEFRFLRNRPEGDRKGICCSGTETRLLSPVGPLSSAGSNRSTTVLLHRNKNVEPLQIWLHQVRTWGFLLASGNLHMMDRSPSGCHLATEEKVAPNIWILTRQAPCHPLLTTQSLKKKGRAKPSHPGCCNRGVFTHLLSRGLAQRPVPQLLNARGLTARFFYQEALSQVSFPDGSGSRRPGATYGSVYAHISVTDLVICHLWVICLFHCVFLVGKTR